MKSINLQAVAFVRALQAEFGMERGLFLWKRMAENLPSDMASEILDAILDDGCEKVEVFLVGNIVHSVKVICKYTELPHTEVIKLIQTHSSTGESFTIRLKYGLSKFQFIEEFAAGSGSRAK